MGNRKSEFLAKTQYLGKNELSLCHKLEFFNPNIFAHCWYKPLIFQTCSRKRRELTVCIKDGP